MTPRPILGLAAFVALIGLAQPVAAQTARYCNNRVSASDVTFTTRPGGYGMVFIDYSVRLRNETATPVMATVSLGGSLGSGFTAAPAGQVRIEPRAVAVQRVGSFTGGPGSTPPAISAVLAQVRVTC
ncbi:hypothetical protein [Roseomonas sp. 18066]|uniref:hypothetical protein n=1 Tax=Roseomonas sp. 18066 TaxID=2681412 RepID=UPI001356D8E1|nr:hypothetical protein [Roseomonas sp. 18066]